MRFCLLFFFSLIQFSLFAQGTSLSFSSYTVHLLKRYEIATGNLNIGDASTLGPVDRFRIEEVINGLDSVNFSLSKSDVFNLNYLESEKLSLTNPNRQLSKHKLFGGLYKTPANFFEVNSKDFKLIINPAINLQLGHSSLDSNMLYTNSRGIEIRGIINERLGFYSFISENQLRPAQHERNFKETYKSLPGAHLVKNIDGGGYDFLTASGYITFKVMPAISMQFGQSRNFIGNGQRSLLLSDFATDYLFLKINTKIWRINYQNIFAKLIDNYDNIRPLSSKYLTAHYLGIDIFDNWNLGFYESVIFHDNQNNGRGFDLYYLNPIIFYRSVEHSLGDADKVMIGVNTTWLPYNSFELYGQFMLNEFRIKDLKARNGHAGNKFGYQLGVKWINVANFSNLDLNIEYNRVRPYSYSHKALGEDTHSVNSYSHYGQPLAHPLGANFSELLVTMNYQPFPKISMELNIISALYGADSANSNWGGNIFLDYTTAEREYNNEVGQGVSTNIFITELVTSWHIKHNLFLDLELKYRNLESALVSRNSENFYVGTAVRLNMWRRKWEY